MGESTVDKALARLLDVQMRLDRATLTVEQAQSRIRAIGKRLEQMGREIVQAGGADPTGRWLRGATRCDG